MKKTRKYKTIKILILAIIMIGLYKIYSIADENIFKIGEQGYISSVVMTDKITGTGPFDTDDTAGNDSSAANNIVRSFDQITYTLETTMRMEESAEIAFIRGGKIHVEATLPENCDNVVKWDTESMQWIENLVILNNGRKITGYYQMNNNEITVPGKQSLNFIVKVLGATNGLEIKPNVEIWLNNKTEDNVRTIDLDTVTVSAAPKYNIELARNGRTSNRVTVDDNGTSITGRIYGYGLTIQLYNENESKGLKGIEIPKGDITFDVDIKLERSKLGNTELEDITNEATPFLWNYKINEVNTEGNIPGRQMTFGAIDKSEGFAYNIAPLGQGTVRKYSTYNSGNISITQIGSKLNVKISDYDFDGEFPEYKYSSADARYDIINYTKNIGSFSAGYIQILVPDTEASTVLDRNYYLTVQNNNFKAQSKTSETTTQMNTSDDLNTVQHVIYKPGQYVHRIKLRNYNNSFINEFQENGDGVVYAGQRMRVGISFGINVTNDEDVNTANSLIKFDGEVFKPTIFDDNAIYKYDGHSGNMRFNVFYVTKPDGSNWINQVDMNNGNIEDLNIYENIEDIPENYTCVGVYLESKDGYLAVISGTSNNFWIPLQITNNAKIGQTYGFTARTQMWVEKIDRDIYTILNDDMPVIPNPDWDSRNRNYIKTEYDETGKMITGTHNGGWQYGQTALVLGGKLSLSKTTIDSDGREKSNYDFGKDEYNITYKLTPQLESGGVTQNSKITGVKLKVEDILPKGMTYIKNSSNYEEPDVAQNEDGTTTLIWYIENCTVGEKIESIIYNTHLDEQLENNAQLENRAIISEVVGIDGISKIGNSAIENRTATKGIQVISLASHLLYKTSEYEFIEKDGNLIYKITYTNKKEASIPDFTLLDILPYNGDMRGTNFTGNYKIEKIDITQVKSESTLSNTNLEVYTTNDEYVKGISSKDTSIGDSRWNKENSYNINKEVKAIAIKGEIDSLTKLVVEINIKTEGNNPEEIYVNNAKAQIYTNTEELETTRVNVKVIGRKITGILWIDENKNGKQNENEIKVSNEKIKLVDENNNPVTDIYGNIVEEVITDQNGRYIFENLKVGKYKIMLDNNQIKYTVTIKNAEGTTSENDSDAEIEGTNIVIKTIELEQIKLNLYEYSKEYMDIGLYNNTSVLIKHYIEGTTEQLSEDVLIKGKMAEKYETTKAEDIDYSIYELVEIPNNAEGEMTEEQIVVIYYYKIKEAKIIVHHYLEGTEEKVSEDEIIDGKVTDKYETTKAEDIDYDIYELVEIPNNSEGEMTEEEIIVIYYYKLKDTKVIVNHYLKGTITKISETIIIDGRINDKYETKIAEDINYLKYRFYEVTDNKEGVMEKDEIVVNYYYEIIKYKVTFVDKDGNIIEEQIIEYGESAKDPGAPKVDEMSFIKWDKEFGYITGDLVVKATYVPIFKLGNSEIIYMITTTISLIIIAGIIFIVKKKNNKIN